MDNRKNNPGRPTFQVTEANKIIVKELSGFGIPQNQIAASIGCNVDTLTKYFEEEILLGQADINAMVVGKLAKKCREEDTAAIIFWCKTRLKFSEKSQLEVTGADGGPIEINEAKSKLLAGINKEEKKED